MKKLIIYLLVLTAMLHVLCTQKKENPVGSETFTEDELSIVDHRTLYASSNDTSFYRPIITGNSHFLYIGNMGDMQATSLIRFSGFEDTASIDSAVITLNIYRVLYPENLPAVIQVYQMNADWDDLTMKTDEFSESMIGSSLTTVSINHDSIDVLRFTLDPALIASWMDTLTTSNYGLCLKTDAEIMLQSYSRDVSTSEISGPQLLLYFTDDSTRYPKSVEASHDLFIGSSITSYDPNYITIENGTAHRIYLSFDLSSFSRNTIINRALLTFSADTTKLLPGIDKSQGLIACYLDSVYAFDEMECELENSGSGILNQQLCSVDLTYQIQTMISDQLINHGFLVVGQYENSQLGRMVFYSTMADLALRPKLEMDYTLPVQSKF